MHYDASALTFVAHALSLYWCDFPGEMFVVFVLYEKVGLFVGVRPRFETAVVVGTVNTAVEGCPSVRAPHIHTPTVTPPRYLG